MCTVAVIPVLLNADIMRYLIAFLIVALLPIHNAPVAELTLIACENTYPLAPSDMKTLVGKSVSAMSVDTNIEPNTVDASPLNVTVF